MEWRERNTFPDVELTYMAERSEGVALEKHD